MMSKDIILATQIRYKAIPILMENGWKESPILPSIFFHPLP